MFIDAYRDRFEVEPICTVLQFAPSTYWSAKRRGRSARSIRDEELKDEITRDISMALWVTSAVRFIFMNSSYRQAEPAIGKFYMINATVFP